MDRILVLIVLISIGCNKSPIEKNTSQGVSISRISSIVGIDYTYYIEYSEKYQISNIRVMNLSGDELLKQAYNFQNERIKSILYANRKIEYSYLTNDSCIVEFKDENNVIKERHLYSFLNNKLLQDDLLVNREGRFRPVSRITYHYDSTGNLTERLSYYNGNNGWELTFITQYQSYDKSINSKWHLQLETIIPIPFQEKIIMNNPGKQLLYDKHGKLLQQYEYQYEYDQSNRVKKCIRTHYMFDQVANIDTSIFHYY